MASSFVGMWAVMMAAMMLPSLVPMLRRYREAAGGADARWLGARTVLVGVGYFFVWTVIGMAVFPVGVGVGVAEMLHPGLSRAVPVAVGLLVVLVGAVQLTAWKARVLACCRADQPIGALPTGVTGAWRHGLRLGVACARGCVGLMVLLVVLGVMDLRVMAVVSVGVTAERIAAAGDRVARGIGWVVIGAGAVLVARSLGVG